MVLTRHLAGMLRAEPRQSQGVMMSASAPSGSCDHIAATEDSFPSAWSSSSNHPFDNLADVIPRFTESAATLLDHPHLQPRFHVAYLFRAVFLLAEVEILSQPHQA